MWFGTYDGVNCYDGKSMEVFRSDFSEQKTLSNNIIHSIQQADSSCLWITTHLGANRFSKDSRQVICNYEFDTDFVIHSNHAGNTWALSYDWIAYYNTTIAVLCGFRCPILNAESRCSRVCYRRR